ncbi:MAG: glycine zipper 2TM domain-containing protein [Phycisphaerae bacterium]|nr:glycine zipper 2TM domain-containing protein [Phycisphaerae bacterium]
MKKCILIILAILLLGVSTAFINGCDSQAKTGALIGTGVGALAGQAIGGDTGSTLIGAGVGAGAGYIIGNETEK